MSPPSAPGAKVVPAIPGEPYVGRSPAASQGQVGLRGRWVSGAGGWLAARTLASEEDIAELTGEGNGPETSAVVMGRGSGQSVRGSHPITCAGRGILHNRPGTGHWHSCGQNPSLAPTSELGCFMSRGERTGCCCLRRRQELVKESQLPVPLSKSKASRANCGM